MRQRNRASDAVWTAFTETLRFIVVPLVLLNLVTTNYPLLTTPFMANLTEYVTFYGFMIVAASTLEAANKPGTYKRMLFGLSGLGFVCMWMFVVFGGGIAEFTYGPYHFRFDITSILYILLIGISLKGLLIIQTFTGNKHLIREEEHEKTVEAAERKRAAARRSRPVRVRSTDPSFSRMSKIAFEVTSDPSVGYSPPPPPPSLEPSAATPPPKMEVAARSKACPVCGERVSDDARECPSCGAWFSRESFRFEKS